MNWETVIGLEVHVELSTKSKIFCSCTTEFGGEPNTHCCPVCTGMPGVLPVLNKNVVEYAIRAGLALDCSITPNTKFDRKNYFYPDLPKAFQTSQLYLPICTDGNVKVEMENGTTSIRIREIHMEEDAGKLIHDPWGDCTLADYNRCGVPLIEIVTQPDFRSAAEVLTFLEKLKSTLEYIDVSDCKMQEGSMRADINVSVRQAGASEFGVRTEMKNMNSFKAIGRCIEFEAKRQIELLTEGNRVIQQTRRWDENKDASFAMRSKENAQDYRYFPEPDLPPVEIGGEWIERIKAALPELAQDKQKRYVKDYALPEYDTVMITTQKALADFFEATIALCGKPKEVSNWIMGDVMRLLKDNAVEARDMTLSPESLARIINLVDEGKINRTKAKAVLNAVFEQGVDVDEYVKQQGFEQLGDQSVVEQAVKGILDSNPDAVEDYKSGKEKAYSFLVGQIMRSLKGKADPAVVNQILRQMLDGK